MTEQRKNSYEDSDFRQVVTEIEEMDAEIETIMASARGKVSGIKTRQKNRKKIAKVELGIPTAILDAVLKDRGLDRKKAKLAALIPADLIEVWIDAAGQFAFLPPDEEHPEDNASQVAARQRQAEIDAVTEEEQVEGAAALNELAGGQVH